MSAKATQEAIKKKLPGMGETMKHMYTNEGGFVALYRGIVPTVAGVAPYVGLNFMIYESVRAYFTPEGESNPGTFGKLGAGAISGAVAQTCTYPLYVPISPCFFSLTLSTDFFAMTGTSSAAVSRLTPCPAWATSTNPSSTPYA